MTNSLIHQITTTQATDLSDTLKILELNIMNNCNRSCIFCPHSDNSYKNTQGHMTYETLKLIVDNLIRFSFKNTLSICGFGEPLLHKDLPKFISLLRTTESSLVELITNGDLLSSENIAEFYANGLNLLNVSVYDKETDVKVSRLLKDIDPSLYIIKRRYLANINLVNRIEILKGEEQTVSKPCYLPSYKMMVDIDGTVLLCCNDWTRKHTFGNLTTDDLRTVWLNNMNQYRLNLLRGNRDMGACKHCNINGTLVGADVAIQFLNH